jgi:hypothetical protein
MLSRVDHNVFLPALFVFLIVGALVQLRACITLAILLTDMPRASHGTSRYFDRMDV